jgi:hypothetical protein
MSSSPAVLAPPSVEATTDEQEWVELVPPVEFESQEAMRAGPRSYTPDQAEVIELAVRTRSPLPEPPLPIDD